MSGHPIFRGLHDTGLAAWAGGSLMGAIGLNGATAALDDPRERASASTAGWTRWAPVNAVALGSHLVGAAGLLVTDWPRVRHQRGVARSSAIKTVTTAAALGVGGWSAVLNRKMAQAGPVPVAGATEPGASTPPDVARTQRQLKLVQWLNPAVTFGLYAIASWQSEQQRPTEVAKGTLQRLTSRVPLPALAATAGVGLLAAAARRRGGSAPELPESRQDAPYDLGSVDVVDTAVAGGDVVDLTNPGGDLSTGGGTGTTGSAGTSGGLGTTGTLGATGGAGTTSGLGTGSDLGAAGDTSETTIRPTPPA